MCGRFVASRPVEDIVAAFGIEDVEVSPEATKPRWNVAPQSEILAVTARRPAASPEGAAASPEGAAGSSSDAKRRRLTSYRWGLVPSWAPDPGVAARMFNARAESLRSKPAFRNALTRRRCLVPSDAFYEWQRLPATAGRAAKQPWCFRSPSGGPLALAGLWEAWRPATPDGERGPWLLSCTIVTTAANDVVAPVHDRMPVLVAEADWERWLDPEPLDSGMLDRILRPAPPGALESYRVGRGVGNVRNEGPELWAPEDRSTTDSVGGTSGRSGAANS